MAEYVHYVVDQKNPHHGRAILEGFGARREPACRRRPVRGKAVHLVGGLQHGSLELLAQIRTAGLGYVFFDRAYLDGGPRSDRLRVVPGAYQHHWIPQAGRVPTEDPRRRIRPWRRGGREVLVVPPSAAVERLFAPECWGEARLVQALRSCTDRPIRVSRKGDAEPLEARLARAWAVVTWSSNVAVEAILAGVPAFVGPWSAARPVAKQLATLAADIEAPLRVDDRETWVLGLARGQFSVDEIRQGLAREAVEAAMKGA